MLSDAGSGVEEAGSPPVYSTPGVDDLGAEAGGRKRRESCFSGVASSSWNISIGVFYTRFVNSKVPQNFVWMRNNV